MDLRKLFFLTILIIAIINDSSPQTVIYPVYSNSYGSDPDAIHYDSKKYYLINSDQFQFLSILVDRTGRCIDDARLVLSNANAGTFQVTHFEGFGNEYYAGGLFVPSNNGFAGNFSIGTDVHAFHRYYFTCTDDGIGFVRQSTVNFCRVQQSGVQIGMGAEINNSSTIQADATQNASINFVWKNTSNYCSEVLKRMHGRVKTKNGVNDPYGTTFSAWTSISPLNGDPNVLSGFSMQVNGYGTYEFLLEVQDSYGNVHPLNPIVIDVVPDCANDLAPLPQLSGPGLQIINNGYNGTDGGYQLVQNNTYSVILNTPSITSFDQNYTVTTDDGSNPPNTLGSDHIELLPTGTVGQYSLKVKDEIGSYRIFVQKKSFLGPLCQGYKPIELFVGGSNVYGSSNCLIILPRDILNGSLFPDLKSDFAMSYALSHFVFTVSSKQGIIVEDGVVLQDGAILKIDDTVIQLPDPETVDNDKNWTKSIVYDDEGRVIGESKSFFDKRGKPIQTQAKNLSKGIVLASQIIYDKYGRPAINTLPAPIEASNATSSFDECDDNIQIGQDTYFNFRRDFVTFNNLAYSYQNFDDYVASDGATNAKLNNPDIIDNTKPGTLGWYYSNNNILGAVVNASLGEDKFIEPYVASTSFPYSRTVYYEDGTSEIESSTLPGDNHKFGSGHAGKSQQLPLDDNDLLPSGVISQYLSIRNNYVFPNDPSKPGSLLNEAYKISGMDENGRKGLNYYDRSGNAIIVLDINSGDKSYSYYDAVGRIACTISPNGISQLAAGADYSKIDKSTFKYNHRGWVIETSQNDAGITRYMYRKDGKVRFSENAQQRLDGKFSYVIYDQVGRGVETGEFIPDLSSSILFGSDILKATLEYGSTNYDLSSGGAKSEVISTVYDVPDLVALNSGLITQQNFVLGLVSYTYRDNGTKTWYSYDERGRIEWIAHNLPGLGIKKVEYTYNPSGDLKVVTYQNGMNDAFYHIYEYDLDTKLKKVYTSLVLPIFDEGNGSLTNGSLQAEYDYYLHGPLKKIQLANNLQGIDYTYTVQGWLKSINNYDKNKDPGQDGDDVFGMTLEYFSGDFAKTGSNITSLSGTGVEDFYNGNIKAMAWFTQKPTSSNVSSDPTAYSYTYDNKYQLLSSNWGTVNVLNGTYSSLGTLYKEDNLLYDPNGNIRQLRRYGKDATPIHDFTDYQYYTPDNGNAVYTNMLKSIEGYNASYVYNAIGQLKSTIKDEIASYTQFDPYGMMKGLSRDEQLKIPFVKYYYDDNGFRYKKETYNKTTNNLEYTTYYVRDASGNIMGIYDNNGDFRNNNDTSDDLVKKETPIHGSERIGTFFDLSNAIQYELTDHLGNVRSTITTNGNLAIVESYSDYYSFGMVIPERNSIASNKYRFGYQGQYSEHDVETDLDGDGQGWNAFELRTYDPVIGRWLSIDPVGQFDSPYMGMRNNPINSIDPSGAVVPWYQDEKTGELKWFKSDPGEGYSFISDEDLSFNFSSFIDRGLWDGPNAWFDPTGEKVSNYVNLDFTQDANGNLVGLKITGSFKIMTNEGGFKGVPLEGMPDYFVGSNINNPSDFSVSFEKHARVPDFEVFGLLLSLSAVVDVAQKFELTGKNGVINVKAFTDIFPSARLTVSDPKSVGYTTIFTYWQPSYRKTHGYFTRPPFALYRRY